MLNESNDVLSSSIQLMLFILLLINFSNVNGFNDLDEKIGEDENHIPKVNLSILASKGRTTPYIGEPNLNASIFQSNESALVFAPITDSDGIKNASLFWEYETINETIYNTTMNGFHSKFINTAEFQSTGYIYENGSVAIEGTTFRMFGNYTYEVSLNEYISEISFTLEGSGSKSDLIYLKVQAKNATTNYWETVFEEGNISDTVNIEPGNYFSTNTTKGYSIFAVSYANTEALKDVKPPIFSTNLNLFRDEYSGIILAPNQSTWVDYYIKAYDNTGNSSISPTYSFLMDWRPIINISELPSFINTKEDFLLNVTVTDVDGVGTIDDNSVFAYYRSESVSNFSSIKLNHISDINSYSAAYRGTIPTSAYAGLESNFLLIVNASDKISGQTGYTATTGLKTLVLDDLAPRLTNLIFEGGVSLPGLENISTTFSIVNITATFTDNAGVSKVNIYYSLPRGTDLVKQQMQNLTSETYFVSLPAAESDSYVDYFFEPFDLYGNTVNTSINSYYADGIGPIIDIVTTYPLVISNISNGIILFNASDNSGLQDPVLWYSYDNITWSSINAVQINYNAPALIDYLDTFSASNVPKVIEDEAITTVDLEVIRVGKVDSAFLTFELNHEQGSDLRIWLILSDGTELLVYDREFNSGVFSKTIDLIEFGLTQQNFDNSTFKLKIQDFSSLHSGTLTNFEIELIHHRVPLGYQYMVTVPAANNDTLVYYFITLTDELLNIQNSSLYSYYSDGLPPKITIEKINSPLDMKREYYLVIEATIYDRGGLADVELYYKISESDSWTIGSMEYDESKKMYVFNIPMQSKEGIVFYKIRAYDLTGLSTETEIYSVEYENARTVLETGSDLGIVGVLGLLIITAIVGSIAGLVYLYKSNKLAVLTKKPGD